jgi:hypothetical protein
MWLGGFVNTTFNNIADNWGGSPATGLEEFALRNMQFIIFMVFILANVVVVSVANNN